MIKGVRINTPYYKHRVYIDGKRLSYKKTLKYIRIGYSGFEWGYGGAGPQQLAFAILLELANEKIARTLIVEFTNKFVCQLPRDKNFSVPKEEVLKIIEECSKAEELPDEYTTRVRVDIQKKDKSIH